MRTLLCFLLLLVVRLVSVVLWRVEGRWVRQPPESAPWDTVALVAFLNHTSLFEPIFAGSVPVAFLWQLASRGVLPVAKKTIDRPLVGLFFRFVARQVVSITREPDHTWQAVMTRIQPDSMIVIAPEGRMMRANGLDKHGQPMSVRGGIADILQALPGERYFLIAYSAGLHHVQVPGQRFPNLFKRARLNVECITVGAYRDEIWSSLPEGAGHPDFKRAVKADLDRRRDLYRDPELEGTPIR